MNNSEGQTQDPVGGMKTKEEILNSCHPSGTQIDYAQIYKAMDEYHNQFTPPPAPIEALRKMCADFIGTVDNCTAFEIFMEGYSASLNQVKHFIAGTKKLLAKTFANNNVKIALDVKGVKKFQI